MGGWAQLSVRRESPLAGLQPQPTRITLHGLALQATDDEVVLAVLQAFVAAEWAGSGNQLLEAIVFVVASAAGQLAHMLLPSAEANVQERGSVLPARLQAMSARLQALRLQTAPAFARHIEENPGGPTILHA